jgi:hypothetical protein
MEAELTHHQQLFKRLKQNKKKGTAGSACQMPNTDRARPG